MDLSVSVKSSGKSLENYLRRLQNPDLFNLLERFAEEGLQALIVATPVDSGETAASWSYEIVKKRSSYTIIWHNSHMAGTAPVAILLQYGHGTGTGGYVQGRDYINPALRPIFDKMAYEAWRAVVNK